MLLVNINFVSTSKSAVLSRKIQELMEYLALLIFLWILMAIILLFRTLGLHYE